MSGHRRDAAGTVRPDLATFGFDTVDLSGLDQLQQACATVRDAGRITDDEAAIIRASLDGAVLPTSSGDQLRVLYLAEEGFIMRTAGPNGMSLVGPRTSGMNGHSGATSVHGDQDVYGTPMTQLMDGRAPSLFLHDSPDGRNDDAAMVLVNLWIPLQQIVQPLVLADGRSIDRRRHQLRYGLATDAVPRARRRPGDQRHLDVPARRVPAVVLPLRDGPPPARTCSTPSAPRTGRACCRARTSPRRATGRSTRSRRPSHAATAPRSTEAASDAGSRRAA